MNWTSGLTAATLMVAWSSCAWADIPPPPPKKDARVAAPVSIVYGALKGEGRGVQAKIRIPKHLVHAGDGAAAPGAARPERAPGSAPAPRAEDRSSLPYGTIIAGLAMSLAAASAVFIVRGNRNGKTAALAGLVGALVLGAYGIASADLIVPGGRRPAPPPEIVIELVEEGEEVTLFIAR